MANLFGIQFGSRFISTKKYEAASDKEKEDFERFNKFEQSQILARYNELDQLIHSGDFEKKVKELKTARFKDTAQFRQLEQYNALRNASDIKSYLRFIKAGKADRMKQTEGSDPYQKYEELNTLINSPEFHSAKVKKGFKKTEAYQNFKNYKSLKKSANVKFYLKTRNSSEYHNWQKLDGSERIQTFFELEALVQSDEFQKFKSFMEDKHRYNKSEEAHLVDEFNSLTKNEQIKWYLSKKQNDPFKEIRQWELTFEDDFDATRLDQSKWMTGYYWGKALMNETYVLAGEKQFFKEENIELRDSVARITTRKENTTGKTWDLQHGFITRPFNFTSGLISTGQSFRQKFGRFEAKIRFSAAAPIVNAFWLVGETIAPQIDVVKSSYKKGKMVDCGLHTLNGSKEVVHKLSKIKGASFTGDFYIYSLEWSPEALIWKINGQEVNRITSNIPNEAMYLTFCTTLPKEPDDRQVPATLEIDWIRCYQKV